MSLCGCSTAARPFTNREAAAAGVGPWRLKASDVIRPFHGVRVVSTGPLGLVEALVHARPGVDSPKETELRLLLVRAGMPEPEVNGVILSEAGVFLAYGDLVFRRYRVLIEYDGGHHREDERQYFRDVDRLDDLMDERWRIVRINKSHLTGAGRIAIARARRALTAAGWSPSSPTLRNAAD